MFIRAINTLVMSRSRFFLALLLLLAACSRGYDPSEIIPIPENISSGSFSDAVSSIELVPLSSDMENQLGQNVELKLWGDSFVVADKQTSRIFRFSDNGEFINPYGKKGRGPQEYSSIDNIQVRGDTMIVFADGQRILRFHMKDGSWISTDEMESLGVQSYYVDDGLLTYIGYMGDGDPRLSLISDDGKASGFLNSKKSVMAYSPRNPVFSESGDDVFFVDSYSNVINKYSFGKVEPCFTFDFGKYAIDGSFYEFENRMDGARFLLSSEFEIIDRFCADGSDYMLEAMIQAPRKAPAFNYGFSRKGRWTWFTCGEAGVDPFAGMFMDYADGVAYFLLDPSLMGNIPAPVVEKIKNKKVLDTISDESNFVIAKVRFK